MQTNRIVGKAAETKPARMAAETKPARMVSEAHFNMAFA